MRPAVSPRASSRPLRFTAGSRRRPATTAVRRKRSKRAYAQTPHPDLAAAYLRVRHGDSTEDRLARARTLARVAPNDPETMLTIGRAALEAHDRDAARVAIAPLLASDSPYGRPTRRVCLLMADIEEAEGHQGAVREWLGRAARAPHDRAWVADGFISDRWAPVSPSGALDAFVWRTPDERMAAITEPTPIEADRRGRRRSRRLCRPHAPSAPPPVEPEPRARTATRRGAVGRGGCPGPGRIHHRSDDDVAGRSRAGRSGSGASRLSPLRRRVTRGGVLEQGPNDVAFPDRHRRRRPCRRPGRRQPARW